MISRPPNRETLRRYTVSAVLLLMLGALLVSRALTSLAPAAASHVSYTHTTSADDSGNDDDPGSWHTHGGGEDLEGDQLADGLPEWLPSPEGHSTPRIAVLDTDGEQVPAGRDIEPLPMPPRG